MSTINSTQVFGLSTAFQSDVRSGELTYSSDSIDSTTSVPDATDYSQETMSTLVNEAISVPAVVDRDDGGNEVIGDLEPFVWDIPHYENLFVYGFGIIVTFGTIGNVLSLVIMQRKRIRCQPTSPYLSALAVADTICLWCINQEEWFHKVFGKPIVKIPCNFRTWIMAFNFIWSSWCIVFVTVERYIAIRYPLKITVIQHAKRIRVISMVVLPFTLCACFSWAIVVYKQTPIGCDYIKKYEYLATKVAATLFAACRTYVPGILIFTFNCLIIYQLYASRKNLVVNDKAATQRKREIHNVTIVVLGISITHVILSLPIAIFMTIMDARGHIMNNFSEETAYILGLGLEMLTYSNHSINFVLYMFTSPRFREEFLFIFGCKQPKLQRNSGSTRSHMASQEKEISTISVPSINYQR